MKVQLRLFGGLSWSVGGVVDPVRGRTRCDVLLALAEARGSVVSVGTLLDRFWVEAPQSGANAVQRHISGLRRQLRSLGVAEPGLVLGHVSGGYRLHRDVATDLSQPNNAQWWLEPIAGASWEPHVGLRDRLDRLAIDQARLSVVRSDELGASLYDRLDGLLTHTGRPSQLLAMLVGTAEATTNERDRAGLSDWLETRVSTADTASELVPRVAALAREGRVGAPAIARQTAVTEQGRSAFRQVVGLWDAGHTSAALDLLGESTDVLDPDTCRRLNRAIVWDNASEAGIRNQFRHLLALGFGSINAERALISADADTLQKMPDGAEVARHEIDNAETTAGRVRALRVDFMRRLSDRMDEHSETLVERLAAIDDADAQVEAQRFAFINELRWGRWRSALERLEPFEQTARSLWPNEVEDFASMAKASLQRSPDPECAAVFDDGGTKFGTFEADPTLMAVTEVGRSLLVGAGSSSALTDVRFHAVLAVLRDSAATGFRLLHDLRIGRPVLDHTRRLADELHTQPRNKQFLYLQLAIGCVAEASDDRTLATFAADSLEPWSGQAIGMWPVDLVIGMANDWIERFRSL